MTVAEDGTARAAPVRYIRSHAALRGLAALMVVAYHLQFGTFHRLGLETATPFFERGYLLVDLFFILSGFVISLTGDADRSTPFDRGEVYDFYLARLARIYPLHLFCLCYITVYTLGLGALVEWRHTGAVTARLDPGLVRSFVAELLLVQSWIPGAPHWNIPSWSISAELFAYAVFPALVALRSRLSHRLRPLFVLFPIVFYLWVWRGSGSLDFITWPSPLRCLAGFILGMVLFDLRGALAEWRTRTLAVCQIAAAAAIVAVLAARVPDPLVILPFALLVITTWQDRGPVPALLNTRFLAWTGDLSYSIYLNHVCLIAIVTPVWYKLNAWSGMSPGIGRIVLIATCFAAVFIVSQWTHRHVEQSSRRLLRRILARPARS